MGNCWNKLKLNPSNLQWIESNETRGEETLMGHLTQDMFVNSKHLKEHLSDRMTSNTYP